MVQAAKRRDRGCKWQALFKCVEHTSFFFSVTCRQSHGHKAIRALLWRDKCWMRDSVQHRSTYRRRELVSSYCDGSLSCRWSGRARRTVHDVCWTKSKDALLAPADCALRRRWTSVNKGNSIVASVGLLGADCEAWRRETRCFNMYPLGSSVCWHERRSVGKTPSDVRSVAASLAALQQEQHY